MPLEVGETINLFTNKLLGAGIIRTVVSNPIYTAGLIAFVVMIVIIIVFRDADTDEPLLVMTIRGGFWVFMFGVAIMFLHNKVLTTEVNSEVKAADYDGVFGGASPSMEDSVVPVNINTDFWPSSGLQPDSTKSTNFA